MPFALSMPFRRLASVVGNLLDLGREQCEHDELGKEYDWEHSYSTTEQPEGEESVATSLQGYLQKQGQVRSILG